MFLAIDMDVLNREVRDNVTLIKRLIVDTRLDIRDYELSETREEQLRYAAEGSKRLEELRTSIITASEYNIFSAIDIARIGSLLDQIKAWVV